MYTLFISTYDKLVTIGLLQDGNEISKIEKLSDRGHSTILVPSIQEILKQNQLDTKNLNEIIVVNGPGSFTGIRLGVTVAKTLAYTLNIKIKTITSIEAIAASIKDGNKIITIDDPKGKYLGKFINNRLQELIYLKQDEAIKYLEKIDIKTYNAQGLNLESIYQYTLNIDETPAHAVKATYIKGIEALNGK